MWFMVVVLRIKSDNEQEKFLRDLVMDLAPLCMTRQEGRLCAKGQED